ncbi:M48 family metalloprotease [Chitinasiproducens palmae]|uniref:Zn-dependent protease, contains TPR repeats n=1 Tax=Chitinasiproducens palmae TaxID=1770053 RepID=A0A1H2PXE2_9BURK|nr:M48 family metalloprotease [Chitinasiproducens palmae]SDV51640.1 Putative Zn-dependent protease, contains TPR repeats [Chitinasiproducens palmae]
MHGNVLPTLGDGSGGELSPADERRWGEVLLREVRRDPSYLDDPLLNDYVTGLAGRLGASARERIDPAAPRFTAFVMRDPMINAFAMPGGFIGVNTGLIATTQSESELASVLAHEIGHVLQRHIARSIGPGKRDSYTALAGTLLGLLAGVAARSADLGMAVVTGSQAFALDNHLALSRSAEQEADRVGFSVLYGAGFDPDAMIRFFGRMERASPDVSELAKYFRTHPLTSERMAEISDRARGLPYRFAHEDPQYAFMQVRARVLQAEDKLAYLRVRDQLAGELAQQTAPEPAANWYGIALAAQRQGDIVGASEALRQARAMLVATTNRDLRVGPSAPSMTAVPVPTGARAPGAARDDGAVPPRAVSSRLLADLSLLQADIAITRQQAAAARTALQAALGEAPSSAAVSLVAARMMARLGDHVDQVAVRRLAESFTRSRRDDPDWWAMLAQSCNRLGDVVCQRRAQAERLALDGAWASAIEQLKQARDGGQAGLDEQAALSRRLREMRTAYEEEREDRKGWPQ